MSDTAYTESFASIYDDIMSAVPYNFWYSYIKDILIYYGKKPHTILDLACGTGAMTLKFARDGKKTTGIDGSSEMLKRARLKIEKEDVDINYIESDIRDININRNFDLVVSLFDSLNYILSIEELKRVFLNVSRMMKDDAVFIFDMNTVNRLKDIEPGLTTLSGKNYTCFWEDSVDRDKVLWQVKLKIYFNNDKLNFYEEFHQETAFPSSDIIKILKSVGFKYIDILDAYTFNKGRDENNRLYYICSKNDLKARSFNLPRKIKWRLFNIFM